MKNKNIDTQEQLTSILSTTQAEYMEIRLEESETTRVQYRGREIEDIVSSTAVGGNVRALVKGGWGFVSFNDIDRLKEWATLAVNQAKQTGKEASSFSFLPPVKDRVNLEKVKKDPANISLSEKKELMDQYNEVIWSIPGIQTSIVGYADGQKHVTFANSEGSFIEQSRKDVSLRVSAVARDGGEVQQAGLSIGSKGDFSKVENLHSQVKTTAKLAVDLLSAPKVKGGEYTVVLDPVLAGVFVHEAFGHLSESDFIYENPQLKEIMTLGRKFGGKHLNIADGAAIPGLRGSFTYDDEGTPSTKTYLIKDGILVGRLHSRETAAKMGEKPTGNARAVDYRFAPIVRMTNTIIEPGQASLEDLLKGIVEGVYVKNWYGGTTSMEMFTFSAGEAYMIRNGKIAEPIRPVVLTGNVFTTLENIDAIANDLDMNQGGGCGKGGQFPLPVSNGSPHIRIQHCLVGGR